MIHVPSAACCTAPTPSLAVTDFWRVQRTVDPDPPGPRFAHFEFARWRDQTLLAARTLQSSGYLTELGSAVVTALRDRLLGWARDDVPDESAGAARQSVADHQVSWRLRHLQPAADPVRQIADAWLAGQPCPPACLAPPQVRAGGAALNDNGRRDLLLLRLRAPGRFARLCGRPGDARR